MNRTKDLGATSKVFCSERKRGKLTEDDVLLEISRSELIIRKKLIKIEYGSTVSAQRL